MNLEQLGFNKALESYRKENNLDSFPIGRVITEHKDRYLLRTEDSEFDAELLGNLRFTAESRYDLPAVGDWVAFSKYDEGKALIHAIYPRKSIIERQEVGSKGKVQIIATNIDFGLIVQAVDRDFNLNRLERYLTICHSSKVSPIIVLSKIDLIEAEELSDLVSQVQERAENLPIFTISSEIHQGIEELSSSILPGKTYCLLGSSGVGKSTLLNVLIGQEVMKTSSISSSVNKGKHVTTHRELVSLEKGGVIIDNPGMREVGIADLAEGLEQTFDKIVQLGDACKFKDCKHLNEVGCAVLEALDDGNIEEAAYDNYQKMQREKKRFETSIEEKHKKDKEMGKLYKNVKKYRKQNKY